MTDDRGHTWKLNDYNGEVDLFGLDFAYHNGPICITCGYAYCHHCTSKPEVDCTGKKEDHNHA